MKNAVILLCYLSISASAIVGVVRYKILPTSIRVIAIMLVLTFISELLCFIATSSGNFHIRSTIYHFYAIALGVLNSAYFIYAIAPARHRRLLILSVVSWPVAGIANFVYLQPLTSLNSNMLMLESFIFITLSLYFIYFILKKDKTGDILRFPHFQVSLTYLVYWSGTLFFWSCIKTLYKAHWKYLDALMYFQSFIEILFFTSLAFILFHSGKKINTDEYR